MPYTKAVRRRHKKSRWGCQECKQRHIKCDEHRPVCVNCSVADRPCSFTSSVPAVPSIAASASASRHPSPADTTPPTATASTPHSQSPYDHRDHHDHHDHASRGTPVPSGDSDSIPPANMAQLALLHNIYTTGLGLPQLARMSADKLRRLFLDLAVKTPFLMNELLAFSSRHLAETHPAQAAHYQHQALQLQTHALRMFNEQRHELQSQDSCLAVVFFSWLIGTHMLSDVRGHNDSHGNTVDRFIAYMQTYRGLRAVTSTTWAVILTTDMADIVHEGVRRLDLVSEGPETAPLKDAVRASLADEDSANTEDDNSSSPQREAFDIAIARIQWTIDAHRTHDLAGTDYQEDLIRMLSLWTLVVDKAVFERLVDKEPAALAVLAHFAVLLFWCRSIWVFGDVGALLLEDIARSVPAAWQTALAWPLEVVRGSTRRSPGERFHEQGGQGDQSATAGRET